MKPYNHSLSSVKKYGGEWKDYIKIHDWFDQTKGSFPTLLHRSVLHNSVGIMICEQVFGTILTNKDGVNVSVRDVGENHCLEDLGWIPSLDDIFKHFDKDIYNWIGGKKKEKKVVKNFLNPVNDLPGEVYMDQRNNEILEFSTTQTALEALRDSFGIKSEDLKKFAKLNNPDDEIEFKDRMVD